MRYDVVSFGEILWDMLPKGKQLGGAPANFAYHCQQQGVASCCISAVGTDDLGNELTALLKELNINNKIQRLDQLPTGVVDVKLSAQGHPSYIIKEEVAWDYIEPKESLYKLVREAKVFCFGTLVQRSKTSRDTLMQLLDNIAEDTWVVFDINIRQGYYTQELIVQALGRADVLKINDDELELVAKMFSLSTDSEEDCMRQLAKSFGLTYVCLTKGEEGSYILGEELTYRPAPKVNVKSTVGAGDSFTAAMVCGIVRGEDQYVFHDKAVRIAAYVCEYSGAMPKYSY